GAGTRGSPIEVVGAPFTLAPGFARRAQAKACATLLGLRRAEAQGCATLAGLACGTGLQLVHLKWPISSAGRWPRTVKSIMHIKILAAIAVISSLAFSQQATTVPPERPFVLPPRIGVFMEAQLTLEQALAMALANNKDIDSSRVDQAKAVYNILAAKG